MSLPPFNDMGDLPPGVQRAALEEITERMMEDSFRLEACPTEAQGLFDHAVAQARHGASIFWVRPALLLHESIEDFVAYWQTRRDGSKRGIVEVMI